MMMMNIAHSLDDITGPKSSKVAAGLSGHNEAVPAHSVARKIGKSAADVAQEQEFHELQCDLHEAREMQEAQLQSAADAKARARVAATRTAAITTASSEKMPEKLESGGQLSESDVSCAFMVAHFKATILSAVDPKCRAAVRASAPVHL
jgi:hypothetical protein